MLARIQSAVVHYKYFFPALCPKTQKEEEPSSLKKRLYPLLATPFIPALSSWRIATMLPTYPALKHPPRHGTLLSCSAFFFLHRNKEKSRLGRLVSFASHSRVVLCWGHLSAPKHTYSGGIDSFLTSFRLRYPLCRQSRKKCKWGTLDYKTQRALTSVRYMHENVGQQKFWQPACCSLKSCCQFATAVRRGSVRSSCSPTWTVVSDNCQ